MDLKVRNEELREFFNEKAPEEYDRVHSQYMPFKEIMTDLLDENTGTVLDLGAGTGLELINLFKRFPDAKVTTVDIAEDTVTQLKRRAFADKLNIICGDFFETDFGGVYDAVISSSALHHFTQSDKGRLYCKIYDSVKQGGQFINSDCIYNTLEEETERFRLFETDRSLMRHFDTPLCVESEIKLLENAGFTDIKMIPLEHETYKVITARKL